MRTFFGRLYCMTQTVWNTLRYTNWPFGPYCSGHIFESPGYTEGGIEVNRCMYCGQTSWGWRGTEPSHEEVRDAIANAQDHWKAKA